jgi:outer membrane protein assembly factor BamD (BamD/ComL family)
MTESDPMHTKRPSKAKPALVACLLLALATGFILVGCASGPLVIPADLDASTLVQRAQEASDALRYDDAITYYQALMERYADPVALVTGEYEIGFIEYKRGQAAESRKLLESLLDRYKSSPEGSLPDRYRVLAEKILAKLK